MNDKADIQAPSSDALTTLELLTMAGSLNTAIDVDFLLQRIGAAAERLLDSEASSILLLSKDGKSLYFKVASGEKAQPLKTMTLPLDRGIGGWVATRRQPEIVNDVQHDVHFASEYDKTSGFITRSILAVPMVHRGELVGVLEVLNKRSGDYGQQDLGLLTRLAAFASASIVNTRTISEQQNFFSHMLELLSVATEATMPGMSGHSARAVKLSRALGRALGMEDYEYRQLYYAAMLHDVGYIALNNQEFLSTLGVRKVSEDLHPWLSARLLDGITLVEGAVPAILHHHERWDGKGYPDGLAGTDIPLGSRILLLVETVEELRMIGLRGTDLYQKAVQEARDASGKSFDPKVAQAFIDLIEARTTAW